MPPRNDSPNRSETFGRLLSGAINSIATYEGKTAPIIEEELGALAIVAGKTIQRYKAGYLPPEHETVKVLAEAAVQRGYLGREWLQRFLHAARYPFADKLLNQLCLIGPTRPRPPRVYENLPAPTYSQFVMRAQAFAEVVDGLQQRSAVVLIVGLGGNGKTSLAREVAARCLQAEDDTPHFDAVVWVSDKDRPGTTNLSVVLDEIARTLDYPGFTQFAHDEKLYEVGQLLKRQRVLVVVDNFETITDGALLAWLLRLPEPSKALITSREYGREFRRSCWPVELRGMSEGEAQQFIGQRLRVLRIEKLVSDQAQLEPLVVAIGGNPKAIEIALGIVKHERRPLQQVVDDLYAARGELFDDLFTRAWALLDEAARRVLLSMTFFPDSASAAALSATADVQGFAFDRSVERLTDLALLDVQLSGLNSPPRYAAHPLVRAFAKARLAEQSGFEAGARERWVAYFHSFALQTNTEGFESSHQFDRIEEDITNLHTVMHYCYDKHLWKYLIEIVLIMRYFWATRGYYKTRNTLYTLALHAAEVNNNVEAQIDLLSLQARALYYQNDVQAATVCCERARTLLKTLKNPDPALVSTLNYAQIRVCLLRHDYEQMLVFAQHNVTIAEARHTRSLILARYEIAEYLYWVGRYDEARQLFQQLTDASIDSGLSIAPIRGLLSLARVAICTQELVSAGHYLQQAQQRAQDLHHRRYLAEINRTLAQLYILRGALPAAQATLEEAIDLFERLGMQRALAEARATLAALKSGAGAEVP